LKTGFPLNLLFLRISTKEKLEIVKERGEPRRRAANHQGFSSPPQGAEIVRANLRIVHIFIHRQLVDFYVRIGNEI